MIRSMVATVLALLLILQLGNTAAAQSLLERLFGGRGVKPLTQAQERALKPKDTFQECDACPEMVVVPSGQFMMGSSEDEVRRFATEGLQVSSIAANESPKHVVTFTQPFAVGKLEVTVDQFSAFVEKTGHGPLDSCGLGPPLGIPSKERNFRSPGFPQTGKHPVVCVSWQDAKAYVAWLSRETGKRYRLLTEAEWEYVARARSTTAFWWGNEIEKNRENCGECGTAWSGKQSAPVGSLAPNPWGLHDTLGNVTEWVEDCGKEGYVGAPTDGSARIPAIIMGQPTFACNVRQTRGGSSSSPPWRMRSGSRDNLLGPNDSLENLGFRVARTIGP